VQQRPFIFRLEQDLGELLPLLVHALQLLGQGPPLVHTQLQLRHKGHLQRRGLALPLFLGSCQHVQARSRQSLIPGGYQPCQGIPGSAEEGCNLLPWGQTVERAVARTAGRGQDS